MHSYILELKVAYVSVAETKWLSKHQSTGKEYTVKGN